MSCLELHIPLQGLAPTYWPVGLVTPARPAISPDWVDERVTDELQEWEDPEDDPVPQPGHWLVWGAWQDGLQGGEGGVDHAHQGPGHEGVHVHQEGGEREEPSQAQVLNIQS